MGLLSGIGIEAPALTGYLGLFLKIIIGVVLLVVVVVFGIIIYFKRRDKASYNIPCMIITPRSDGRVVEVNPAVGGYFKSAKVGGVTSFRIKRKGIGVVDIPPPTSDFLTGASRTLFLAQKGIDDYEPIKPECLNYIDTPEGVMPILKLKAVNQDATAWKYDNESSAKKRFTFESFWDKYQVLISLMTFVFVLFLILYIQWIGMKDVVTGLQSVADALRSTSVPIITPGG